MRASLITTKRASIEEASFNELLHAETARLRRSGEDFNAALSELKNTTAPINRRGGHVNPVFDLGDARFTSPGYIEIPSGGWGLVYSIQGSAPGGVLDFDFDGGGIETLCEPGAMLRGNFSRMVVRRNAASIQAGSVLLRVLTEPDVTYGELAKGVGAGVLGNPSGVGSGPAGATTQAYNSAAGNVPTAATDGLSLAGVTGVRAIVKSNGATTISAAELHWWQYSTADAAWGESDMLDVYGLATANNIWVPLDKQVWVPEGRIYAELRSGTNSGSAGAFTVRLQTWGGA